MGIRHLVLLSAYLLTDGGISSKGKNWLIYFGNKDPEIINSFQKALKSVTGVFGSVTNRTDGTKFIRMVNNQLAKDLFNLSPAYRTKACKNFPECQHLTGKLSSCKIYGTIKINGIEYPKATIPKQAFASKKLANDFIKIYASCDGGVSVVPAKNKRGYQFLVRKVLFSVKHPNLSNQLRKLLEYLEYEPYQLKDQIRLTKRSDIKKFKKEIGFIKNTKISGHSKFLTGLDKNMILKKIIDSYKDPRPLLDFLTKKRSSSGLNWD